MDSPVTYLPLSLNSKIYKLINIKDSGAFATESFFLLYTYKK